jgi:hypothetical protein
VTAEPLPQDRFLRKELEALLKQEGVLQQQEFAPVTIIDAHELDHLEPVLASLSLVSLLGMKTGNHDYRDLSMKNFLYSVFNGFSPNQTAQAEFRDLAQSYTAMLFGPPVESSAMSPG